MAYALDREHEHAVANGAEAKALERLWIAAEARADRAKQKALKAERAAEELRRFTDGGDREVVLLIGEAKRLAETRDEAEAEAERAFDRFWNARTTGA